MNEEEKAEPASEETAEEAVEESQEHVEEKEARQVPLEALEAERKKRQDVETQLRMWQEWQQTHQKNGNKAKENSEEDEEELVNRRDLNQFKQHLTKEEFAALRRDISEETYKEANPQAIRDINSHLKEILERKPWLASSIEQATNRYARAYEIVQDYKPQIAAKGEAKKNAEKIVENSKKPGSPSAVGKSQQLTGSDYLKSIAGTKDFREYRKKLLGRK